METDCVGWYWLSNQHFVRIITSFINNIYVFILVYLCNVSVVSNTKHSRYIKPKINQKVNDCFWLKVTSITFRFHLSLKH